MAYISIPLYLPHSMVNRRGCYREPVMTIHGTLHDNTDHNISAAWQTHCIQLTQINQSPLFLVISPPELESCITR